MISYKEILPQINTFIFDVDGVLTSGEILLINNDVIRTLHSKDGYAIQYAAKKGFQIFIITGGNSVDVKQRLEGLGVTKVFLRSANKKAIFDEITTHYSLDRSRIAYMGDDIPDIPVLQEVGLATCPQDAAVEVKSIAHYQSPIVGGKGCVRDLIEQVMRVQGKWMNEDAYFW
jgi:3-deoxy-D-manno-octulosonate 8-phosphate phosphatase (KDO 8-P phosphatase)